MINIIKKNSRDFMNFWEFRNISRVNGFKLMKYDIKFKELIRIVKFGNSKRKDLVNLVGLIGEAGNAKMPLSALSINNLRKYNDNVIFDSLDLNKGDEIEIIKTGERVIL